MKKGLIIASSVLFLSGLAACGGNKDNNAMDNTQNDLRNTSTKTELITISQWITLISRPSQLKQHKM